MVGLLGGLGNNMPDITVNLPEGMDLEEIKEIIDYYESKKLKSQAKSAAVTAAIIPGALSLQYILENNKLSPPILHLVIAALENLANIADRADKALEFNWFEDVPILGAKLW